VAKKSQQQLTVDPVFPRPGDSDNFSKYKLPPEPMLPEAAYQIVHDEAMLDGNARLNLATFVSTTMDDHASKLYSEAFDKNMIDKDEYPATAEIEDRCWKIVADLWNAPDPEKTIGTSAIGSSEACMLGGLALKRRWQQARRAEGKSTEKPNIIMSSAVQVVWEKFANYWDVEPRYVPISLEHKTLDGHDLEKYVDENTIGLVAIMGVTYTGMYEPIKEISAALDKIEKKTGFNVPIHVDAASGGFIAPFLQPELEWDFRIKRVHSINTSGHKYGLVYPGLGWVVWRKREYLPDDLIFKVSYLGGEMPTLAINFSRPGAQVLLQYYVFMRLGFGGYRDVQARCRDVAKYLSKEIGKMGPFKLWNDGSDIPVFAWYLKKNASPNWDLHDLSNLLRQKGWQVPSYPMPDDMPELTVQRVVVRSGLSFDLADSLLADMRVAVDYLDGLDGPLPREGREMRSFAH
jgi:glutamate decarboxylase